MASIGQENSWKIKASIELIGAENIKERILNWPLEIKVQEIELLDLTWLVAI